ncbi:MAG TPA: CPBP family intramembrane metalloprotease [Chloroflexaceae bacterium]|nr:CPBP family intramembrane metalloprotease [Chloroflexaceae bacterium]
MVAIRSFVGRRPLLSFVVLAYLCSWGFIPLIGMPLPWGPMFAALLIVGLAGGRAGVVAWARRSFRPSAHWGWYALAMALPVAFAFTGLGVNLWMGAAMPAEVNWLEPLLLAPVMLLFGGMLEEPGWTGFALPRLIERWRAAPLGILVAALVMAAIRFSWHLPLMIGGHVAWSDIVWMIGAQIVFVWLYNRGSGSALTIMLLHWMNNTFSGEFVSQLFHGADSARQSWIMAGLWCALAIGVLIFAGPRLGLRGRTQTLATEPIRVA